MSTDRRLRALSIAPAARAWLASTQQARVLYAFTRVVNLVNQDAQVLSLVSAQLGNGPFSVVLEDDEFPGDISTDDTLLVFENGLWIADWLVDVEETAIWQPQPDWKALPRHSELAATLRLLAELLERHAPADSMARLVLDGAAHSTLPPRILQSAEQHIPMLFEGLIHSQAGKVATATKRLAGLGPGLTPAGDDLLLGAMYGLWASRPATEAQTLSEGMAALALERTHALSGAWLAAGARGEAAQPWHTLAAAIASGDTAAQEAAVMQILPTGHTSGADALAGFLGLLRGVQA